jgi:hypothetical protein
VWKSLEYLISLRKAQIFMEHAAPEGGEIREQRAVENVIINICNACA